MIYHKRTTQSISFALSTCRTLFLQTSNVFSMRSRKVASYSNVSSPSEGGTDCSWALLKPYLLTAPGCTAPDSDLIKLTEAILCEMCYHAFAARQRARTWKNIISLILKTFPDAEVTVLAIRAGMWPSSGKVSSPKKGACCVSHASRIGESSAWLEIKTGSANMNWKSPSGVETLPYPGWSRVDRFSTKACRAQQKRWLQDESAWNAERNKHIDRDRQNAFWKDTWLN